MWFKKKSQISGFNANTAYDGTDWRTSGMANSWSVSNTLPSAADASNYFYLPALGYYLGGLLNGISNYGYYWSSSANSWSSDHAYQLSFQSYNVSVYGYTRDWGFRVEPTFE